MQLSQSFVVVNVDMQRASAWADPHYCFPVSLGSFSPVFHQVSKNQFFLNEFVKTLFLDNFRPSVILQNGCFNQPTRFFHNNIGMLKALKSSQISEK